MARVNKQASFEDVPLMDEVLADEITKYLATKREASAHRAADREIKKRVPKVEKPTRFVVGESYFIEATPFSRDGHAVRAGSGQRLQIKDAAEG